MCLGYLKGVVQMRASATSGRSSFGSKQQSWSIGHRNPPPPWICSGDVRMPTPRDVNTSSQPSSAALKLGNELVHSLWREGDSEMNAVVNHQGPLCGKSNSHTFERCGGAATDAARIAQERS